MSSNKSKRYTSEFKAETVKRALKIGPYKACEELGVSSSTIYKWIAAAGYQVGSNNSPPDPTGQNPFQLSEENKKLKKENARLKEEREILKKATRFFAKLEK